MVTCGLHTLALCLVQPEALIYVHAILHVGIKCDNICDISHFVPGLYLIHNAFLRMFGNNFLNGLIALWAGSPPPHSQPNLPTTLHYRTIPPPSGLSTMTFGRILIHLISAIDGNWSNWSDWNSCSKSCGSGKRSRIRECNNPSPGHYGHDCYGYGYEDEICNPHPCPGN